MVAIFHLSRSFQNTPTPRTLSFGKTVNLLRSLSSCGACGWCSFRKCAKYNRKSVFLRATFSSTIRELWMELICSKNQWISWSRKPPWCNRNSQNQSRESEIVRMLRQMNSTLAKHGSVLVPVFALGRMQEMLVVLDEAFRKKPYPRFRFFAQAWAWIWLITSTRFQKTQIVFASIVKS